MKRRSMGRGVELRSAFNQGGKRKFTAPKVLKKFPLVLLVKSTMEAKYNHGN
jgi:hypothetical protein